MENFNWTKFKEGKIIVYCKTIEEELNFLQECDKQGLMWCSGAKPSRVSYLKRDELDGIYFDYSFYGLTYLTPDEVEADEIERTICWATQPKTKFTWREVFANIKEGEVYTLYNKFIKMSDGRLVFGDDTGCMSFSLDSEFTKSNQCIHIDFNEARKQMKLGKTVRSLCFGRFYKIEDNQLYGSYQPDSFFEKSHITLEEIEDDWLVIE